MRPSAAGRWAECETKALHHPPREPRTSAAAWVGRMAHAQLAGEPESSAPSAVAYDGTTPSSHIARIQAAAIVEASRSVLDTAGWRIVGSEIDVAGATTRGRMDLVAWSERDKIGAIIELRTGHIGSAWLQVAAYVAATDALLGYPIGFGGVLHAPRRRVGAPVPAEIATRPAAALVAAWSTFAARVAQVEAGAPAMRTPGTHCNGCRVECAVRGR